MIWASAGPSASTPRRARVCVDAGRLVAQRLEEPRHAVAGGRRSHQQRHDVTLAQFAREIVEHAVARRLDVADQLLHQRVVVVGEALEHGIARLLFVAGDAARHRDHDGGRDSR